MIHGSSYTSHMKYKGNPQSTLSHEDKSERLLVDEPNSKFSIERSSQIMNLVTSTYLMKRETGKDVVLKIGHKKIRLVGFLAPQL